MARHRWKNGSGLDTILLGVSKLLTVRAAPEPVRVDQDDLYLGQPPEHVS